MPRRVLFSAWPRFDEAELTFWRDLRDALSGRGLSLVLASSTDAPAALDVEHVRVTRAVDAFWPTRDGALAGVPVAALGLDERRLLDREAAWGAPAILAPIEAWRREAVEAITAESLQWLETVAPVATVIWNGAHVAELILAAASRRGGAPVLYVERAPIPNALFADEDGLSTASRVARMQPWPVPTAEWLARAEAVSRQVADTHTTWWEQPAARRGSRESLRDALGIPGGAQVVLFAGQVDEDTQRFLFSPLHDSNLSAFEWLLDALKGCPDVYVLGKHHPHSRTRPERYAERLAGSGLAGAWRTDLEIGNALSVADAVAAVNSTVLYEALARQRPVLAMGDWLLKGQGVAFETADGAHAAVNRWLRATAHTPPRRWHETLGYLLSTCLYAYDPSGPRAGLLGAADLADRIDRLASPSPWAAPEPLAAALRRARGASSAAWTLGDPAWAERPARLAGRLDAFTQAHSLRYSLLLAAEAIRQDRRTWIWGTDQAGRLVADVLARAGAAVAGFVGPTAATAPGMAGLSAASLQLTPIPDFVVITPSAFAEIPALEARGFVNGVDFVYVDVDTLQASIDSDPANEAA